MSNRFALVLVAIAIPVAGFFIHKNSSESKKPPEERTFTPIAGTDKEPVTPPAPEPELEPEPEAQPEPKRVRHDQVRFDRFTGTPVEKIITILDNEAKTTGPISEPDPFHTALPKSPFPFREKSEPRNPEILKAALVNLKGVKQDSSPDSSATNQQGTITEPTLLDRWRVNIAHVALGSYPAEVPDNFLIPNLNGSETELFPAKLDVIAELDSGPVFVVADFDNDGIDDLVGWGGGAFWKSMAGEPIETNLPQAEGLFPADFDGDGDVDIFATRRHGLPNSLWVNDGDGSFIDFTEAAGLLSFGDSTCATWADFDRDGELDLAIGNLDAPLEVYRAAGQGTFEYVSDKWSLEGVTNVNELAAADLDGDHIPELVTGIFDGADRVLRPNADAIELEWENGNSTTEIFDFDNDGDFDLITAMVSETPENSFVTTLVDDGIRVLPVRILQNDGEGNFTNITTEIGLPEIAGATDLAVADLDADGYEDLIIGTGAGIPNRVFWNRDGIYFREATAASAIGFMDAAQSVQPSTEGLVIDGRVLKTKVANENEKLIVHLETKSAGAKVRIVTRDHDWVLHTLHRQASGYQPVIFGLDDAKTIETIEVFWPDAATEPVKYIGKDVEIGKEIAVERGGDAVIVLEK